MDIAASSFADANEALQNIYEACTCIICQSVMHCPMALECGHHFCFGCIEQWMKRVNDMRKITCPTCRAKIYQPPHESVNIKAIVEVFMTLIAESDEDLYADMKQERATQQKEYKRALAKAGNQPRKLFSSVFDHITRHVADREDRVQRCAYCHWELDDNYCRNCDRYAMSSGSEDDENGHEFDSEGEAIDLEDTELGMLDSDGEEHDGDSFDERARRVLLDEEVSVTDGDSEGSARIQRQHQHQHQRQRQRRTHTHSEDDDDEEEEEEEGTDVEVRAHLSRRAIHASDDDEDMDGVHGIRRDPLIPHRTPHMHSDRHHTHHNHDEDAEDEDDSYGSMEDFIDDDDPGAEERDSMAEEVEDSQDSVAAWRRRNTRVYDYPEDEDDEDEDDDGLGSSDDGHHHYDEEDEEDDDDDDIQVTGQRGSGARGRRFVDDEEHELSDSSGPENQQRVQRPRQIHMELSDED